MNENPKSEGPTSDIRPPTSDICPLSAFSFWPQFFQLSALNFQLFHLSPLNFQLKHPKSLELFLEDMGISGVANKFKFGVGQLFVASDYQISGGCKDLCDLLECRNF